MNKTHRLCMALCQPSPLCFLPSTTPSLGNAAMAETLDCMATFYFCPSSAKLQIYNFPWDHQLWDCWWPQGWRSSTRRQGRSGPAPQKETHLKPASESQRFWHLKRADCLACNRSDSMLMICSCFNIRQGLMNSVMAKTQIVLVRYLTNNYYKKTRKGVWKGWARWGQRPKEFCSSEAQTPSQDRKENETGGSPATRITQRNA